LLYINEILITFFYKYTFIYYIQTQSIYILYCINNEKIIK
jgi:hypothetical protein